MFFSKARKKRKTTQPWSSVEVLYLKQGVRANIFFCIYVLIFAPSDIDSASCFTLRQVKVFGFGRWTQILQAFPFKVGRTGINLKDKYRNLMKSDETYPCSNILSVRWMIISYILAKLLSVHDQRRRRCKFILTSWQ